MSDARLNELEFKVAHQDVLLEDLNSIVVKQQEKVDRLEAALKDLSKRLGEASSGDIGPGNQKPPHY